MAIHHQRPLVLSKASGNPERRGQQALAGVNIVWPRSIAPGNRQVHSCHSSSSAPLKTLKHSGKTLREHNPSSWAAVRAPWGAGARVSQGGSCIPLPAAETSLVSPAAAQQLCGTTTERERMDAWLRALKNIIWSETLLFHGHFYYFPGDRLIKKSLFRSDFYVKFYVKMEIHFEVNIVMLTLWCQSENKNSSFSI